MPLRRPEDTDGEVFRTMAKLEAAGQLRVIFQALGNSTAAFRPFVQLAGALSADRHLPVRTREVVILWLAARQEADYEWQEHIAKSAAAGVTDVQREALRAFDDSKADLFEDSDLLALQIAWALFDQDPISDDAWAGAQDRWGVEGAVNLVLVIGLGRSRPRSRPRTRLGAAESRARTRGDVGRPGICSRWVTTSRSSIT